MKSSTSRHIFIRINRILARLDYLTAHTDIMLLNSNYINSKNTNNGQSKNLNSKGGGAAKF